MEDQQALQAIRVQAESAKTARALAVVKRRREGFFNESGCSEEEVRREYFRKFPEARLRNVSSWGLVFEATPIKRIPRPPVGYAYKGGAARIALAHALGLEASYRAARDFNLIRVAAAPDEIDTKIAKKIMKEDAKHGNGVECIPDFETYLTTRDLTINETLYCGETVVASHQAVRDLHAGIIFPTNHVLRQSEESRNRVAAKMIRFYAERKLAGCMTQPLSLPCEGRLVIFSFLLHLERALESKGRLADTFCQEVANHKMMPEELEDAKNLQEVVAILQTLQPKLLKNFQQVKSLSTPVRAKKTKLRI